MSHQQTSIPEYREDRLKKCEVCGEMYSVTYKTCPFCEEDRAMEAGRPLHRRAEDFRNKKGGHALSIMALLLVIVLLGSGGVYFFGDTLADLLGMRETSVDVQTDDDSQGNEMTILTLGSDTMTLSLEESATLYVVTGSGSYVYSSANEKVATVNQEGVVIPMAVGETTITVTDGTQTATCDVTVTDGVSMPSGGETTEEPEDTEAPGGTETGEVSFTLNREDFTLKVGESFQLKPSLEGETPVWAIDNTSVATVAGDGTVTGVGAGVTTAYATIRGTTVECIVRVS